MTDTILITGASGQLGNRIFQHLLDSQHVQAERLIATTRNPERLEHLAKRGVAVRSADFNNPDTLIPAFAGANRILIVSTDHLDLAGDTRLKQQQAAVAAAREAGATHLAYTSMLKPEPGSPVLFANDHYGTEEAIKATCLTYTIFRNNAYHENLLLSLPGVVAGGRWLTSAGVGRVGYAARDDMAAAIAARLAADTTENDTIELSGPKAYSYADVATIVTQLTGKPIELVDVSDAVLADTLSANGVPQDFARLLASVDHSVRIGDLDSETDVLEQLLGRKPQTLGDFLKANQTQFAG